MSNTNTATATAADDLATLAWEHTHTVVLASGYEIPVCKVLWVLGPVEEIHFYTELEWLGRGSWPEFWAHQYTPHILEGGEGKGEYVRCATSNEREAEAV